MSISVDRIEPRASQVSESDNAIQHTVEKLTSGVVSVSWSDPGVRRVDRPSRHYRVGVGNKPPVDLSFDELSGRLAEVQLVLQDESVPVEGVFAEQLAVEAGCPVVDTSLWGDGNYLDYHFDPRIVWQSFGTLSVEIDSVAAAPIQEYDLGNLKMLVDGEARIVGLRFFGLNSDQQLTIRQAEPDAR